MKFTEIETRTYRPYPKELTAENSGNRVDMNIIRMDELSNGYMVNLIQILINGSDRTEEFFGKWNRITTDLNRYQFSGFGNRFCFIPAETGYFLLDIQTLQKIMLPIRGIDLEGNIFEKERHLLFTHNHLYITDVYKGETITYDFSDKLSIEWAYFIDDYNLRVIHYLSDKCSVFNLKSGAITETRNILGDEILKDTYRCCVWTYKKEGNRNILEIECIGNSDKNKLRRRFILEE
jgi:hypothetical protein